MIRFGYNNSRYDYTLILLHVRFLSCLWVKLFAFDCKNRFLQALEHKTRR